MPYTQAQILEFYQATQPWQDRLSLRLEDLAAEAVAVQALCSDFPWVEQVPADIFFNYLAWYRVNNEAYQLARPSLRRLLEAALGELLAHTALGVASGLGVASDLDVASEQALEFDLTELALAVNNYLAEYVKYAPSSEITLPALAVLARGQGRCGEESLLLVQALRSLGIPARQIYVPWWSHCDDNHAWVEFWTGQRWAFVGAMEPEICPDRGWFIPAAARAPLIRTRCLLKGDTAQACYVTAPDYGYYELLSTPYFPQSWHEIKVLLPPGADSCSSSVLLQFWVYNQALPRCLLSLSITQGESFTLPLGLAELNLRASWGEYSSEIQLSAASSPQITLELGNQVQKAKPCLSLAASQSISCQPSVLQRAQKAAPAVLSAVPETVTEVAGREHLRQTATKRRRQRCAARQAQAEQYQRDLNLPSSRSAQVLSEAGSRAGFYAAFLQEHRAVAEAAELMFTAFTSPDLLEADSQLLAESLAAAQVVSALDLPAAVRSYCLAPRIELEPLRPWRWQLSRDLSALGLDTVSAGELYDFLWQRCQLRPSPLVAERGQIQLAPAVTWLQQEGSREDVERLFVACWRSLHRPARLNPLTAQAQIYQADSWQDLQPAATHLILALDAPLETALQTQQIGLGRLTTHSRWQEFNLAAASLAATENSQASLARAASELDIQPRRKLELNLPPGKYELYCQKRLPSGALKLRLAAFELGVGESLSLKPEFPPVAAAEMLSHFPCPELLPPDLQAKLALESKPRRKEVYFCLEAEAEPSQHVLRELSELLPSLRQQDCSYTLLARTASDLTLLGQQAALAALCQPSRQFVATPSAAFYRSLFVEVNTYPLVLVYNAKGDLVYRFASYEVGAVSQLCEVLSLC